MPTLPALVLLFLLFALVFGAAGFKYYQSRTQSIKLDIQRNLASIASLKIDQISEWRRKRLDALEIGMEAEGRRTEILGLLSESRPPGSILPARLAGKDQTATRLV